MKENSWVALDIDGVLLDVAESYDRAVKRTAEKITTRKGIHYPLRMETIRELRKKGRFGDDYQLTESLVLAAGFSQPQQFLAGFPKGRGLKYLRRRSTVTVETDRLKDLFDRIYFGTESENRTQNANLGLWRKEKPLVEATLLEEVESMFRIGCITGRDRRELKLAEDLLGYKFPHSVTRGDATKPDPQALRLLVGNQPGIYLGDTHNDRTLVENFRDQGGRFRFVMIDQNNTAEEVLREILAGEITL